MDWIKEKRNDTALFNLIRGSHLFHEMSEKEIADCLDCSCARIEGFVRNDTIFSENDIPAGIMILISGSVAMGRHSSDGKRNITSVINTPGDVFGYGQLFLSGNQQGFFATALKHTEVLVMPRNFLAGTCEKNCPHHNKLISNMFELMAHKALNLDSRLEIIASGSLRRRIAKFLLINSNLDNKEALSMSRQEMSDYLNTTRPSLSRELMKMQNEGLIDASGKTIQILNHSGLENELK